MKLFGVYRDLDMELVGIYRVRYGVVWKIQLDMKLVGIWRVGYEVVWNIQCQIWGCLEQIESQISCFGRYRELGEKLVWKRQSQISCFGRDRELDKKLYWKDRESWIRSCFGKDKIR